MKKNLLFIFMLTCVFLCLFALSVSAEVVISESNLDESGDIVGDILADIGNNHHILSVDISYADTSGQTKNGKFYYETSFWEQKNQRQIKYIYVPYDFDMSQMIYIFDKSDFNGNGSYDFTDLIKLYEGGGGFKMYTYKSYENGAFTETVNAISQIQAISYSKYFCKFPDKGFGSKAPKLTTITYNGREPIADTLIVSPLIDEIFSGSFGGDGQSLTANSIVTPFKKLIFEDREGSVSLGQYCFTRCMIEEIYFGKGTYNLHNKERIALLFEKDYANGEGATLQRVILSKDAKIASGEISWNVGSYDVIVLGKESESKSFYEANNQGRLPCAKSVTYNPCYYGHTSEDDYNCETPLVCTVCGETLSEAIKHDAIITVSYPSSFHQKGIKTVKCQNEGCQYDETIDASPVFKTNGYSIPENGEGKIAICFAVDKIALDEYEKANNESLQYGAFAIAYKNITDSEIIDTSSSIKASVDREYASFELIISGFETEEHKSAELSLGAYVIDKKGNVTYLQAASPKDGESYHYISYNEIIATLAS